MTEKFRAVAPVLGLFNDDMFYANAAAERWGPQFPSRKGSSGSRCPLSGFHDNIEQCKSSVQYSESTEGFRCGVKTVPMKHMDISSRFVWGVRSGCRGMSRLLICLDA